MKRHRDPHPQKFGWYVLTPAGWAGPYHYPSDARRAVGNVRATAKYWDGQKFSSSAPIGETFYIEEK